MATKPLKSSEPPKKWERIYESEETISIWKYDSEISMINPYEVEIKYKKESEIKTKKTKK
jgi:hypothetical protein